MGLDNHPNWGLKHQAWDLSNWDVFGAFFTMNDVIFDGLGVFNGEKPHHNSRDSSGGNGDNGD